MKRCSHCSKEKALTDYYKQSTGADGRRGDCKKCIKTKRANHYMKNKDAILRQQSARQRERYHDDMDYRIRRNLRVRMKAALDGALKADTTIALLGCDVDQFREHLESQFTEGMGWGQKGLWHIDHRIPLAAFDLTIDHHQRYAFHWSNCQPLWAEDNRAKSDSFDSAELEAYLNSELPEYK